MDVDDTGDSGDEYKPSTPSPKAPAKKDKGKQRARLTSEESDVPLAQMIASSSKTVMQPAQPRKRNYQNRRDALATGEIHETACEHCAKKGLQCEKEVGGGACVACSRGKIKCMHAAAKKVKAQRRRISIKVAKRAMPVEKKRVMKSRPYVEVSDEDSEPATFRHQQPAPPPAPTPPPAPAPASSLQERPAPTQMEHWSEEGKYLAELLIGRLTQLLRPPALCKEAARTQHGI